MARLCLRRLRERGGDVGQVRQPVLGWASAAARFSAHSSSAAVVFADSSSTWGPGRFDVRAATGGASSTTTCTLVPPTPNELTPALRTPSHSHGPYRLCTVNGVSSRRSSGFGLVKCSVAGIALFFRHRIVLIRPATPAADLQVADVRLDRHRARTARVAVFEDTRTRSEPLDLDGITQRACRFRVSRHSSPTDASMPATAWASAMTVGLRRRIGCRVAHFHRSVVVDRRARG